MKRIIQLTIATLIVLASAGAWSQNERPDVEVRTLADGVWIHTTYRTFEDGTTFPSHGLIVREGEELTLIDTAWGEKETELLLDAIAVQIGLPVTKAVTTHFHGDRSRGIDLLEAEGVEAWAHPLTREISTELDYAVADNALDGIDTPGQAAAFGALEVFYPGPAHSEDNIMVWLPQQQILFGGCAIRGAADRDMGNVRDADVAHWSNAMALTEARYGGAKMVVVSHAEPAGPELIGHTEYLARLAADSAD